MHHPAPPLLLVAAALLPCAVACSNTQGQLAKTALQTFSLDDGDVADVHPAQLEHVAAYDPATGGYASAARQPGAPARTGLVIVGRRAEAAPCCT